MAIWQLRAWVVPRTNELNGARVANELQKGVSEAWSTLDPELLRANVERLGLEPARSWDSRALLWGREDSNYLRALVDGSRVREIETGIDARSVSLEYCRRLSDVLCDMGAVLVTAEGRIVEASLRSVAGALRRSAAWRFVTDPRAFLDAIGHADVEPN